MNLNLSETIIDLTALLFFCLIFCAVLPKLRIPDAPPSPIGLAGLILMISGIPAHFLQAFGQTIVFLNTPILSGQLQVYNLLIYGGFFLLISDLVLLTLWWTVIDDEEE